MWQLLQGEFSLPQPAPGSTRPHTHTDTPVYLALMPLHGHMYANMLVQEACTQDTSTETYPRHVYLQTRVHGSS